MKKSLGADALAYPTPIWIVGTYDDQGKPNVMTVAWGGICSSNPPCVGVSLRKARHSFEPIETRKAFTVSVPSEEQVAQADFFGIASGKTVDKFAAAGLTPVRSDLVDAPYVKEFPCVLECKLLATIELGVHTQFVGQIVDVKAEEDVLGENGRLDIEKARPILFAPGTCTYHALGKYIGRAFEIGKQLQ